jgi:hypothetical protein
MGSLEGTLRIRTADRHWRARFAAALVISAMVGALTYAATYRALVVISTPGATTSIGPSPASGATASTGTHLISPPGH